jgi:hypothetical protein
VEVVQQQWLEPVPIQGAGEQEQLLVDPVPGLRQKVHRPEEQAGAL